MEVEFYKPLNIKSALELLEHYKDKAVIVNGGSDIVIEITEGKVSPEAIIYIADIKELMEITEHDGTISIGGTVTYAQMLKSPIIKKVLGMVEAVRQLGSPPIREVATAAGNLGTGAPSADCTTMLMGLEAKVVLKSANSERIVAIEDFFPGSYKTVLEPNELIKEIYFKAPKQGWGSGFVRFARRKSQDIAKVLVSVSLTLKDGICSKAVIGLGALNATAVRSTSIEQALTGKKKEEALQYARSNFPKEAGLRESRFKHYKELVISAAMERAVAMAWNNAEGM